MYCIVYCYVFERHAMLLLDCHRNLGIFPLFIPSINFILQVDNIGFLMAHVFLLHKIFPPWVYQVLWTNLMMYLCGAKTGKLTSFTRICIGDLARKTRLWILGTLKTLCEIGEEFRGILMQSSLQFSMVWKTFSFARLFIANFP